MKNTEEYFEDRQTIKALLAQLAAKGLLKDWSRPGASCSYLCDRGDSGLNAETYKQIITCDALSDFNTSEILSHFGDCPVWVPLSQVRRAIEIHGLNRCQYFSIEIFNDHYANSSGVFCSIQLLGFLKDD